MDPLSITVSIIGLLQAVSSTCETLKTIKDLPKAFEHVETHLPLVQKTLGDIQNNLRLRTLADGQRQSIGQILEHCQENGEKLKNIFDALKDKFQKDADSKSWGKLRGWYCTALQGVKGHRVESLMANILRDLEKLSLYESFSLATREDIDGIKKALGDISEVEPSLEDSEFPQKASFSNVQNISEDGYGQQNTPAGGQNTFNSGKYNITGGGQTINFVTCNPEQTFCLIPAGIPDPKSATKRVKNQKGKLLKSCYKWILSNDDFIRWRNEAGRRLLWIKGNAGKGKTMLLCGIVETFEDVKSRDNQARIPVYFFCDATDDQLNTAESVIQGLLAFLIDKSSQTRSKYLDSNSTYRPDWDMLVQKVEDVLRDFDGDGVYLIVDALDECVNGREKLLKAIVELAELPLKGIKILVSSRISTEIEDELSFSEQVIELSLEHNKTSVSYAIDFFIADQITVLGKRKRYSDDLRERIREYLKSNAHDTFLWVSLVCKELTKCKLVDSTYETLKSNFPPELNGIYGRMVESINSSSENPGLCKQMLAIACAVYRPVNWCEMKSLLGSPTANSLDSVIGSCGSFLTVQTDERLKDDDDRIINFVHLSAKDFLLENQDASKQIIPHGLVRQHYDISERSIRNTSTVLKRDMYGLSEPGFPIEKVSPPMPDPLASVRYSCVYWPRHLLELDKPTTPISMIPPRGINIISMLIASDKNDFNEMIKDGGILHRFIKEKYLYWLEALSLLSEIPEGVRAMTGLESFLRNAGSRDLYDWVRDAWRLILVYKEGIEVAPLQVYASALTFSPMNSLVKKKFNREWPTWIEKRPKVKENWGACLQRIAFPGELCPQGPPIVAYSNDDQQLATTDEDGVIFVVNPTTGKYIRILEGHRGTVWSIAFSPDGKQMASSSTDNTIKLWDISSGDYTQTLIGHEEIPISVSFSHCSQKIATVSGDGIIKIWRTASGQCIRTLQGSEHDGTCEIAFSDSDDQLISGSEGWIETRDTHSWNQVDTMVLGGRRRCTALSRDGQQVASELSDNGIGIWDTTSGDLTEVLQGHEASIGGIAFSKDSRRLASYSEDSTIKIWDLTSSYCLRTFENDSGDTAESMDFSNDGQRLAVGLISGQILILDVHAASDNCGRFARHEKMVRALAWSFDGKRVASGSYSSKVMIWDATSGTCLQTLNGYGHPILALAWSIDGLRVVSQGSASNDAWESKLEVWNATSDSCLLMSNDLPGYFKAACSSDGKFVAASTRDHELTLVKEWDIQSGACTRSIQPGFFVRDLWYDPNNSSPSGLIWREYSNDHEPHYTGHGLGISGKDLEWIVHDGNKLLWIPLEYRPDNIKVVAVNGSRIAIGCNSGHVLIVGVRVEGVFDKQ